MFFSRSESAANFRRRQRPAGPSDQRPGPPAPGEHNEHIKLGASIVKGRRTGPGGERQQGLLPCVFSTLCPPLPLLDILWTIIDRLRSVQLLMAKVLTVTVITVKVLTIAIVTVNFLIGQLVMLYRCLS